MTPNDDQLLHSRPPEPNQPFRRRLRVIVFILVIVWLSAAMFAGYSAEVAAAAAAVVFGTALAIARRVSLALSA